MKYCLNPEEAIPVMRIFDLIGESIDDAGFLRGINGNDFATELAQLEAMGKAKIEVHISSAGGSIIDGMVIYQAIKNSKTPVDTVCVGVAISMAGVILQAGAKRLMAETGKIMIHNPSGGDVKELQELKETIISMMCPRTGISEDEMSDIMDSTEWYNYKEALEMKLIDECYTFHNDKEKSQAQMSAKRLMNIVNTLNTTNMKGLGALLGLNDSATEKEFIAAVKPLIDAKNKMEDNDDKLNKLAAEKKTAEDALNAANKKLEDALNEKKEMEDAKKIAEDAANKVEAEDAINQAVKGGKLKADQKDKWVTMFVEDKEFTKGLLADMNAGTRAAAQMETPKPGEGTKKGSTIGASMAKIAKRVEAENKKRIEAL